MISYSPSDFLLSGLTLVPSYGLTLLETGAYVVIPPSTIKYIYKVSIQQYFDAISSFSPLGEAYLLNLKNQLIGLGYIGAGWNYYASEHHIYGSSRIGVHQTNTLMRTRYAQGDITMTLEVGDETQLIRGKRHYELSNHLGNVQVVVSDKRVSICDEYLGVERFEAEVLSAVDYYPFGMMMPDRQWYANSDSSIAVNGFNGMRKDDEISGVGNSLDFGARIYDSRLGRFFSVDRLEKEYPSYSSYTFAANSPVANIDENGDFPIFTFFIPIIVKNWVVASILYDKGAKYKISKNPSQAKERNGGLFKSPRPYLSIATYTIIASVIDIATLPVWWGGWVFEPLKVVAVATATNFIVKGIDKFLNNQTEKKTAKLYCQPEFSQIFEENVSLVNERTQLKTKYGELDEKSKVVQKKLSGVEHEIWMQEGFIQMTNIDPNDKSNVEVQKLYDLQEQATAVRKESEFIESEKNAVKSQIRELDTKINDSNEKLEGMR